MAEAGRGCSCSRRCWPARARCPSRSRDASRPTDSWSRRRKNCRATAIIVALRRPTSRLPHSRPASCAIASCCARRASTSAAIRSTRPARCSSKSAPRCRRADFALRAAVAAEITLQTQHPERALAELDRIPQPLPREDAVRFLALRARALFALNRPAAGVTTAFERERASEQPGRSARQSPADLARLAAERRRQRGFHGAARFERNGHRLAGSRSRSARLQRAIRSPRTRTSPIGAAAIRRIRRTRC